MKIFQVKADSDPAITVWSTAEAAVEVPAVAAATITTATAATTTAAAVEATTPDGPVPPEPVVTAVTTVAAEMEVVSTGSIVKKFFVHFMIIVVGMDL